MDRLRVDEVRRLVAAARTGDEDAFESLYRAFHRLVHGVLLASLPVHLVEDVVQEVFMTAFEKLGGLNDAAAFGGWLTAIARNRATDVLRKPRAVPLPDEVEAVDDHHHEALAILAVIQKLPEAYREPLTLRLVEGLTGPEIARETGLTEGSVRVNLHRGMKQLRELLA